jgi:hypothetical protein
MNDRIYAANLFAQRREVGYVAGLVFCVRNLLVGSSPDNPNLMVMPNQLPHGFLANAAGPASHKNSHAYASG